MVNHIFPSVFCNGGGCGGTPFRTHRAFVLIGRVAVAIRAYTAIHLPNGAAGRCSVCAPFCFHEASTYSSAIRTSAENAVASSQAFCGNSSTSVAAPLDVGAVVEPLCVRERRYRNTRRRCVRVPRILLFGGDVVSVTALEALHTRMRCIVANALGNSTAASRSRGTSCASEGTSHSVSAECDVDEAGENVISEQTDAFVRDHITVVCPALPHGMTPEEATRRFTRQYPVARYCVEHGLPLIPVDDSKSLNRSTLLTQMLSAPKRGDLIRAPSSLSFSSVAAAPASPRTPATNLPSRESRDSSRLPSSATPSERDLVGHASIPNHARHTWTAQGRPLKDYDLAIVVSFRYFLPQCLLRALPPVINMHPSLLPRYRGASPIFSALLHNEPVGGVSIIQMKPEQKMMDSGSVLWQCEVPITPDMDIRLYFPLVTQIGAAGLCDLVFGEADLSQSSSRSVPPPQHISNVVASTAVSNVAQDQERQRMSMRESTGIPNDHSSEHSLLGKTSRIGDRGDKTHPDGPDDGLSAGRSAPSSSTTKAMPSWFALRQRSLMPLIHRHPRSHLAIRANKASFPDAAPSCSPQQHQSSLSTWATEKSSASATPNILFNVAELPLLCSCLSPALDASPVEHIQHLLEAPRAPAVPSVDDVIGSAVASREESSPDRRYGHPWTTLCRPCTRITPEAVRAASKAHRALFFQSVEGTSPSFSQAEAAVAGPEHVSGGTASKAPKKTTPPLNKKTISPSAAAAMAVTTKMQCAEVFPASVRSPHCDWPDSFAYSWKFAQAQIYRPYAHFADDPHHAPLLPKDAAVLRFSTFTAEQAFGVWRAFVGGEYFQPSVNATLDKSGTPVRNQLVHRGIRRLLREQAATLAKSRSHIKKRPPHTTIVPAIGSATANEHSTSDETNTPIGIVVGKHVDLDVFRPEGVALLAEAERSLRIPCTFTRVTNPVLWPDAVRWELAEVEQQGQLSSSVWTSSHAALRRARFYRAPPPVFRALLGNSGSSDSPADDASARQQRVLNPARFQECGEVETAKASWNSTDSSAFAPETPCRPRPSDGKGVARTPEPKESEEAPEDYVPDIIHAAPPTQHPLHIPPGTGYFPVCDERYGAIKCKEGWFVWEEAHMKSANKAQPAVLIRKGLAMKTGVLYVGLFSEYA